MILFILTIFNINPLIQLADSLYSNNNFFEAATEYERFLYNFPSDSNREYAYFKLGLTYLKNNESEKGENVIRKVIELSNSYSRKAQLVLAKNFMQNSKFTQARLEIQELIIFTGDTIETKELNRILGWINLEKNELKKAKYQFSIAHDSEMVKQTRSFDLIPRKNPFIAILLSSIIPGTGEIYCGHYWTGIASFMINAASVIGIVLSIKNENYVDAALILSIFFNRFYLGSRHNAYDFATEFNEKLFQTKLNKIKQSRNFFPNP